MAIRTEKVNPENDLGFGSQPVIKNQPLINKDGSVNVRRKGLSPYNTADNYHTLITMGWGKFWVLVLSCYLAANIFFATIYVLIGPDSMDGAAGNTGYRHFLDAFFFSAQTISTVGYGHISPKGIASNSVAAIESMIGLLAFALATGLLYGRFSKPSAKFVYSDNLLVAPYAQGGNGLMFRVANMRKTPLIDLKVEVIFSYNETVNGKTIRKFFPLELERSEVSILTMNWTIVHPLNNDSPLKDITSDELDKTEATFAILMKAFDDTFSQTVHSRTAYQHSDIIWGAKFTPMFDRDEGGRLVLDLSKINDCQVVAVDA